jgi:hypothetical protein
MVDSTTGYGYSVIRTEMGLSTFHSDSLTEEDLKRIKEHLDKLEVANKLMR